MSYFKVSMQLLTKYRTSIIRSYLNFWKGKEIIKEEDNEIIEEPKVDITFDHVEDTNFIVEED